MVAAAAVTAGAGLVGAAVSSDSARKASNHAVDAASAASDRQANLAERQYQDYVDNFRDPQLEQMRYGIDRTKITAGQADEQYATNRDQQKYYFDQYKKTSDATDKFRTQTEKLGTQDYQDQQAGLAMTDVRAAGADQLRQMDTMSQRRGINPASAAAIMAREAMGSDQTLMQASAGTRSRQNSQNMYLGGLQTSAGLGNGLLGAGAASGSGAIGAAGLGLSAGGAGLGMVGTASGISNNAYSTGSTLWGNSATTMANGANTAINFMKNDPFSTMAGSAFGMGMQGMMGGMSGMSGYTGNWMQNAKTGIPYGPPGP